MSVNAHRVINIEYAGSTFQLNDQKIYDFICEKEGVFNKLNLDGEGTFDLSIDTLKELAKTKIVSPGTRKAILADIAQAEKDGERFVLYSCF